MAWVAVDEDGTEAGYEDKPVRASGSWETSEQYSRYIDIPKGSIEKLIGKKLTWEDEPVELEGEK